MIRRQNGVGTGKVMKKFVSGLQKFEVEFPQAAAGNRKAVVNHYTAKELDEYMNAFNKSVWKHH